MRHRDFGQPVGISYSSGDVTISTTFPEESRSLRQLQEENKKFLDPWRTSYKTDSPEAKILTIRYKQNIVGQIILWNFKQESVKSCSISYWVVENFTNKGVATSAVELACGYAFNELGVDEIDATIQPENSASIRVIEKLKFPHRKMIGEQKFIEGRWQGFVVYTVTRNFDGNL